MAEEAKSDVFHLKQVEHELKLPEKFKSLKVTEKMLTLKFVKKTK